MARADQEQAPSRIDAVIDEEARRLLAVEPSAGFDAGVMSSIARSRRHSHGWSLPRLALAGGAAALLLAAVVSAPWWAAEPGSQPTASSVSSRPVPGAGGRGPMPAVPEPVGILAADSASAAVRPVRRVQPSEADRVVEEAGSEGPPPLEVASMGHPESLQVPSLQVADMSIEAVQVPSVLDSERRDPGSGPDKEQR